MPESKRRYLTPEEYLAIESVAEYKSEYFDGEMYALHGADYPHMRVASNLQNILTPQLAESAFCLADDNFELGNLPNGRPIKPDVTIIDRTGHSTYSTSAVICRPRAVIEVLAPDTESDDRSRKFRHYKSHSSFSEYVLVALESPSIERFHFFDGHWIWQEYEGLDATVPLTSVGCELRLREVFEGTNFAIVSRHPPL